MKALNNKQKIIILIVLLFTLILVEFIHIHNRTSAALLTAKTNLSEQNIIKYHKQDSSPLNQNISFLNSTQEISSITLFQGNYFVASKGGLTKYSPTGQQLKHYTSLTGLSENDLTSLTTWAGKLFIGTRTQGLLVFDGEKFSSYSWPNLKTEAISALLNDNSRLLIGTFAGGLLEFDGEKFSEIKIDGNRLKAITSLSHNQQRLFIQTFDNGLWVIEPTKHNHFTINQGLPSNRVVGVTQLDNNLLVATDFGLSIANLDQLGNSQSLFQTLITVPTVSSLVKSQNSLIITQDNGQIWQLPLTTDLNNKYLKPLVKTDSNNAHLIELENKLWLASNKGLWQLATNKLEAFSQTNKDNLSSNIISALAIDNLGQLWVGHFRNGIDIYSPLGHKITHLENDYLREINHIDITPKGIFVATSQGLVSFDSKLHSQRLTKSDGLLSHNISSSYTLPSSDNLLLATTKGLAIGKAGKFSLLTAIQGLPSNNTYSISSIENTIYVATLTGLAQISNGKVIRTYKDANSSLNSNWITALQPVNNYLFIGTYGGGVYQLMPNGQLRSFVPEIGRLAVNLNAIFSDNKYLYIGTLTGLWVYELATQHWNQVKLELPSSNVLSITGNNNYLYIGTTNGIAKMPKDFFNQHNQTESTLESTQGQIYE